MRSRTDADDEKWIAPNLKIEADFNPGTADRAEVCLQVRQRLDTKARGNWGTVVEAVSSASEQTGGETFLALKIMRGRHLGRPPVYDQFAQEALLLRRWETRGSAARLIAAGFIEDPQSAELPVKAKCTTNVDQFLEELKAHVTDEWRPFLVMTVVPFTYTLYAVLLKLRTARRVVLNTILPLSEMLDLTIQGLELLQKMHDDNFYYEDHKPEHVIWHNHKFEFLDWNGGEWLQGPIKGSNPQGLAQFDVQCFIGYVIYSLFTGRRLDGGDVRPIERGTAHPEPPPSLAGGGFLDMSGASVKVDDTLLELLSRPFWEQNKRFSTAQDMANALRQYQKTWQIPAVYQSMQATIQQINLAQSQLSAAKQQLDGLLARLIRSRSHGEAVPSALESEATRLNEHLQRFIDNKIFLGEGGDR